MIMLTDDERKLLHKCHHLIGYAVASPAAGIEHLAQSLSCGFSGEFSYKVARKSLTATWSHYEDVQPPTEGAPSYRRFDEPHLRVEMALPRIRQWAATLPAELVARARIAWATYPVYTRDLAELARIVHEAIDLSAPAEQLELFEVA